MALNFRKSKKIMGVRYTVSKSGVSQSVGNKFGRITTNTKGQTTVTTKIPGTGIYDRQTVKKNATVDPKVENRARGCVNIYCIIILAIGLIFLFIVLFSKCS